MTPAVETPVGASGNRWDDERRFGVAEEGSWKLFGHAMATAVHDADADIRSIQAMLDHLKLDQSDSVA